MHNRSILRNPRIIKTYKCSYCEKRVMGNQVSFFKGIPESEKCICDQCIAEGVLFSNRKL